VSIVRVTIRANACTRIRSRGVLAIVHRVIFLEESLTRRAIPVRWTGLAGPRRHIGADRGREITAYVRGSATTCPVVIGRVRSVYVRRLRSHGLCFVSVTTSPRIYVAPSRALVRLQRASCHRGRSARFQRDLVCTRDRCARGRRARLDFRDISLTGHPGEYRCSE